MTGGWTEGRLPRRAVSGTLAGMRGHIALEQKLMLARSVAGLGTVGLISYDLYQMKVRPEIIKEAGPASAGIPLVAR